MTELPTSLISFLFLITLTESAQKMNYEFVTCGSLIKLLNTRHNVRLHSHDVKYGSGSGQQSVTGMADLDDHNSHWLVKGTIDQPCKRGEPVKCGDAIRLMHSATGCLAHSHHFQSPLSKNQEVSCFGKGGVGDTGDVWKLMCDGELWKRNAEVRLKHVDTGIYLAANGQQFGRPINGQNEIIGIGSMSSETAWKTAEGVFIKPTEKNEN